MKIRQPSVKREGSRNKIKTKKKKEEGKSN